MTSLADLKKSGGSDTKVSTKEKKDKVPKDDKPKLSKEELRELRLKNLKIRRKDPEKEKQDKAITEAALKLLGENPNGLQVKEIRAKIFESTDTGEFAVLEKRIRYLLRAAGCERSPMEGTKRKVYKSPK